MKKINQSRFKSQINKRLKTSTDECFSKQAKQNRSRDTISGFSNFYHIEQFSKFHQHNYLFQINEKQNSYFRKSQTKNKNRSTLLRNIIDSNDRKRTFLLHNLIDSKKLVFSKEKQNKYKKQNKQQKWQKSNKWQKQRKQQKSKKMIRVNSQQRSSLSRRKQKIQKQQIKLKTSHILYSDRIKGQIVSNKDSQWLQKQFSKRLKQIKLRKYRQNDEIQIPKNILQAYGSSIMGQDHRENQDSIQFTQDVYVLCDGHGSNGKPISNFLAEMVHNSLNTLLAEKSMSQNKILETYKKIDLQLQNSNFDISFSGCTCVSLVRSQNTLYCISLGDSRAIISRGYTVNEISVTHKPDKPEQRQRIQNYGGVVRQTESSKDKFSGPMRIWAPGKNSWGPGLALSRAFGDKASRRYGVISVPQVTKLELSPDIQFIIIGSDGLFDFFADSDICQFVKKLLRQQQIPKEQISHELVKQAKKKWISQSDDISCILIFT